MALTPVEGETWVFAESAYGAENYAPVRSLGRRLRHGGPRHRSVARPSLAHSPANAADASSAGKYLRWIMSGALAPEGEKLYDRGPIRIVDSRLPCGR